MMSMEAQQGVTKVRDLLKSWGVIIYTGDLLDDLTLMDVEVDGLYEEHQLEAAEYAELKLILRRAIRETEEEK